MTTTARLRLGAARTVLALTLLTAATALLGGCNTTAGFGQDVSATGHAVTNSADTVRQKL